jgi:hypothetical protein
MIMRLSVGLTFGCLALAVASGASAKQYSITATGYVSSINGTDGTYTNNGSFGVGSPVTETVSFDDSSEISYITTSGTSTTADYIVPMNYMINIGSFAQSGSLAVQGIVIDKNYNIGGGLPNLDSIGFVGFITNQSISPISFSTQGVGEQFYLGGYDLTASTLSGFDLNQIGLFGNLPVQFGSFSFTDSTFDNSVIANFNINSVTTSVPEPATWGMILIGFALIGFVARRKAPLISSAAMVR